MSTWFTNLLGNTFVQGLALGLVVCIVVWIRALIKSRSLVHDVKKLREHLHTKLEIDSEENERRKKELEMVKNERDNLRNMVQILNQKPGRRETRQFYIYQKAIDIMFEKAPGFAPAWQLTLKEAEAEYERSEKGIIPFFKRMAPSSSLPADRSDVDQKKAIEQHLRD